MYIEQHPYWVWLSCIPEVTPKLYYQVLRQYGSPERFFRAIEGGEAPEL